MDQARFSFDLLDKYTPDIVIRNLLGQVEEATRGYVIGNIERYDGQICTHKRVGFTPALEAMIMQTATALNSATSDIQEQLGEQDSEKNKFEVFLTVKGLEYYKYRMMFIEYNTISYPVTLVMNEQLAYAYSGKRNTVFVIESMKKLEDVVDGVLNSEVMVSLIQNLINESLRQEDKSVGIS